MLVEPLSKTEKEAFPFDGEWIPELTDNRIILQKACCANERGGRIVNFDRKEFREKTGEEKRFTILGVYTIDIIKHWSVYAGQCPECKKIYYYTVIHGLIDSPLSR